MPTKFGSHRLAQAPSPFTGAPKVGVPAGAPQAAPAVVDAQPVRPDISLPPDYDDVNKQIFRNEFEAIPLPDLAEAKANALVCNSSNMNFIRSMIPVSPVFYADDFFTRMAKHRWRAARPSPNAPGPGSRGLMPMGGHRDLGQNPMMVDRAPPVYGAATGWEKIAELDRVNAYGFRGDKRGPKMIRAAGGFQPPSMRTDDAYVQVIAERFVRYMMSRFQQTIDPAEAVQYIKGQGASGRAFVQYQVWRAILKSEELHIGRMVADEFLRGFTSISRDVRMAYDFGKQGSADRYKGEGFGVYALHSEGGFLLPPRAQHMHGTKGTEAEIAHPGPIPWDHVMAFRTFLNVNLNDDRTFKKSGVIFVRRGFRGSDPAGFSKVFAALGSLGVG